MADSAPVAPSVSSFDPADWQKKVDSLERSVKSLDAANVKLRQEKFDLETEITKKENEVAGVRGEKKQLHALIDKLEKLVAQSENLKELDRLRDEVKRLHQKAFDKEKYYTTEKAKSDLKISDLAARTTRAEGRFQALESTADILSKTRDKAMAEAHAYHSELILAIEKQRKAEADLAEATKELIQLRTAQAP